MEAFVPFLFVFFVIVVMAVLIAASQSQKKTDAAWAAVASKAGLAYAKERRSKVGGAQRYLEGTHRGYRIKVNTFVESGGNSHNRYTRFTVSYPDLGLGLELKHQHFFANLTRKLTGGRDFEVGDEAFDQAVVVKADSQRAVRAFLTQERQHMIRHVLTSQRRAVIRDQTATYIINGHVNKAPKLMTELDRLADLADDLTMGFDAEVAGRGPAADEPEPAEFSLIGTDAGRTEDEGVTIDSDMPLSTQGATGAADDLAQRVRAEAAAAGLAGAAAASLASGKKDDEQPRPRDPFEDVASLERWAPAKREAAPSDTTAARSNTPEPPADKASDPPREAAGTAASSAAAASDRGNPLEPRTPAPSADTPRDGKRSADGQAAAELAAEAQRLRAAHEAEAARIAAAAEQAEADKQAAHDAWAAETRAQTAGIGDLDDGPDEAHAPDPTPASAKDEPLRPDYDHDPAADVLEPTYDAAPHQSVLGRVEGLGEGLGDAAPAAHQPVLPEARDHNPEPAHYADTQAPGALASRESAGRLTPSTSGLAFEALSQALFAGSLMSYQVKDHFQAHYAGRRASFRGTLERLSSFSSDMVFEGRGTKATIQMPPIMDGSFAKDVRCVVQLDESAADTLRAQLGKPVTFEGTLVGCDAFMRTVFLADGGLEGA